MADRAQPLGPAVWAGAGAAALVLALTVGAIAVVALRADAASALAPSDWEAVRFTILQASLSALVSVALAVPVARALARRRFQGRGLLVTLLGAPFILPVIVAVIGLIAVFGQGGLISQAAAAFGLEAPRIYGLQGVVLAHVFFNLPLATRFVLQGWQAIPAERFRLAASLDMSPGDVFRLIERPMLRAVLPGALLVVFLICLTSFAVALTLGGGPRATTIELAIYQAFRFDFDLSKAALLALVQVAVTLAAAAIAWKVTVPAAFGTGLDRVSPRLETDTMMRRAADIVWIVSVSLFPLTPLALVVLRGLPTVASLPTSVWQATGRSLVVALSSAALALLLAGSIAAAAVALQSRRPGLAALVEGIGYLTIAASPLVIGTALFIVIFPVADPAALALAVTALVNAMMSMPFALRVLLPALSDVRRNYGRLADSLNMPRGARLRHVYLPRLRAPIGFALGLSAALSMGDLGVIALFADPEGPTLPLQVYRLMAAYQMDTAAGAALVLVAVSVGLFWLFDRGGRLNA